MTVISTPLWLQGGTYAADDDRALLRALVKGPGIVGSTDLAVSQNGTPNMSVNVAAGRAFVQRTSATDFYLVENDAVANLTISAADPTNPRRDLIVARVFDAAFSGALNQATVEVVTGTPAGSPVDPTVPANSFVLARVAVAAATASIVTANITDLRTFYQVNQPPNANIVYNSTGTFTATQLNGARAVRVRAWGPGGGGGGAATSSASSAAAGGGGSGAYAEALIDASTLTLPVTVTVGTGGAGGVAGSNQGSNGSSASSFGALVVAGAGSGGQASGVAAVTVGIITLASITIAAATAGDIKVSGGVGTASNRLAATAAISGTGAACPNGGGAARETGGSSTAGIGGNFPGGGGSGACTTGAGGQQAGGNGANGLVTVELVY